MSENKIQRMKKIILEAAEQAWLSFVPKLEIYKDLFEFIQNSSQLNFYVADFDWEDINSRLNIENVVLLIWPEGGWTEREKVFW